MKKISLIAAFASLIFLGGCTTEYVATRPAEDVVVRPEPTETGVIWVEPEYRWSGTTYVLVPGHYEKHTGVWVKGHWHQTRNGYHWVPGHWR